jgi:DNA-directed RNA polymerase specialized sigma24 family protein
VKHEVGGITDQALERLLACFDDDREKAAEKYLLLRQKLVSFFRWRGAAFPDDCADRTLNVAARKLAEGQDVRDLASYCGGIARMVLLEARREEERERAALEELAASVRTPRGDEEDTRMAVFNTCLDELPPDHRELILSYYRSEQSDRIVARQRLAARLGIPLNALRIRAFRIRSRLEASVNALMTQTRAKTK